MGPAIRIFALFVCTLVVASAFTASAGVGTHALFSDTETAGGTLPVGNDVDRVTLADADGQHVMDNGTKSGVTATGPDTSQDPSTGENTTSGTHDEREENASTASGTDGLSVAIAPEERTSNTSEPTTYDIVVEGATDGIAGYYLTVTLSNRSIGTFESFEHNYDPSAHDETVTGDEIDVSAGLSTPIYGTDRIELGTVTIAGNASGRTDLVVGTAHDIRILSPNASNMIYNVSAVHDGELVVTAANDPPNAENDGYTVAENETLSVSAPGVLGNDTDPGADGSGLSVSVVSGPSNGSLGIETDGSFRYTPDSGFVGEDTFTYEARDGDGGTDTATVSITVIASKGENE